MTPGRPSHTAEAVCFMRAAELARPEPVLRDPYAAWFLGAHYRAALAAGRPAELLFPSLQPFIACRHRFFDDAQLASDFAQLLVLGAGYDMRAYRLPERGPAFEVDFPATAARKARLLRGRELPARDLRTVPLDLGAEPLEAALAGAGFVVGAPTFFVWEGVSMYLPRAAVKSTLRTLWTLGGPGSRLVMDFWLYLDRPDLLATVHRVSAGLLHLLGEPVTFALHPEEGPDFLARHGWRAEDVADAAELERRHLRDGRRVYPASWVVAASRA